ncbi:MAG TPA: AbrB/MazE/SpoVT family DNA-binding domain-containing protein [Chloroflexota bacterium]|nr:AbrB/MazE/SpoVT family DNA-binding domain-containing protein [Chloroflexota bacterium]
MKSELFASERGLAITIPPELVDRYHLAAGGSVEVTATDEGLILEPLDVAPWFSI